MEVINKTIKTSISKRVDMLVEKNRTRLYFHKVIPSILLAPQFYKGEKDGRRI